MSLNISANVADGQASPLPLLSQSIPTVSDNADSTDTDPVDTVSIGDVLPARVATYSATPAGTVLGQNPGDEIDTFDGAASATSVDFGPGGAPSSVTVPELDGMGEAGDGSVTPSIDYLSTTSSGSVAVGGPAASEGGTIAATYEGFEIDDTESSASVSLSSDLSQVQSQSRGGQLTLALAQALQADTVVDPTTGGRSFASDQGKADLVAKVTNLLESVNFTSDEATSGAQQLADAIDGSAKAITLSLQHRGDQSQSFAGASTDPLEANTGDDDLQEATDVDISLDTGTGALGVDLHMHDTDTAMGASEQHVANLARTLTQGVVAGNFLTQPITAGNTRFDSTGNDWWSRDYQSGSGAVLQESQTYSRFFDQQTNVAAVSDDGAHSYSASTTDIEGRLRSQDVGEAAALGQAVQTTLAAETPVVASLYRGVASLAAGSPSAGAAKSAQDKNDQSAAASLAKTARTAVVPAYSAYLGALNAALTLLQSVKPAEPQRQDGKAETSESQTDDKGKLSTLDASQEHLDVDAVALDYDGHEALSETNAYLGALYEKPSAAAPSSNISV